MIDVQNENLMTLSEAARSVPGRSGKRGVSASSVWRWYKRGIREVKLETVLIGATRRTSSEALARFFQRVTAAADGEPAPVRTPAARERAIRKAERELAEAGI